MATRRSVAFLSVAMLAAAGIAIGVHFYRTAPDSEAKAAVALDVRIDPIILSAGDYYRLQSLREDCALRDEDLAAMGLTTTQAVSALTAVVDWVRANASSVDDAKAKCEAAKEELHLANRAFNVGPQDDSLAAKVIKCRDALISAQQSKQMVIDGLKAAVADRMTAQQRQTWQGLQQASSRQAGASISEDQKRAVLAIGAARAANMARIGAVTKALLPIPEELMPSSGLVGQ